MKTKTRLKNRVRGWLPKESALPRPPRIRPNGENTKSPAKPEVTTIHNRRLQLNTGLIIGLGIALTLIGFLGWLSSNYTYETLKSFFLVSGLDPNGYYLFNDLIDQIAIYLMLMSTGAVALLWGGLMIKSHAVRRLFSSQGPHARLGNGLIGGGGALALGSTRSLFLYFLTSDYFELQFFFAFFLVGAFLLACGILALRRK
jgi:hypothetical protein